MQSFASVVNFGSLLSSDVEAVLAVLCQPIESEEPCTGISHDLVRGGKARDSTCAYFGFQKAAAVDGDAGPPLRWDR